MLTQKQVYDIALAAGMGILAATVVSQHFKIKDLKKELGLKISANHVYVRTMKRSINDMTTIQLLKLIKALDEEIQFERVVKDA